MKLGNKEFNIDNINIGKLTSTQLNDLKVFLAKKYFTNEWKKIKSLATSKKKK